MLFEEHKFFFESLHILVPVPSMREPCVPTKGNNAVEDEAEGQPAGTGWHERSVESGPSTEWLNEDNTAWKQTQLSFCRYCVSALGLYRTCLKLRSGGKIYFKFTVRSAKTTVAC